MGSYMNLNSACARDLCWLSIVINIIVSLLILSTSANATTLFNDDFEDGNASGWLHTELPSTRGNGVTGVELHNGCQMAYVQHSGEGRDSLSHDFNYLESDILSFTMHAVANSSKTAFRNTLHSRSGVVMSFLNFLNVPLGNISLVNATNPSSLGSHSITIDSAQHVYSAPMNEFAKAAGFQPRILHYS